MIPLVRVILTVLVLAEVLQQILFALQPRHLDKHLAVSLAAVLQITLKGVKRRRLLCVALLHHLKRRHVAMALCDVHIQAVVRESEQQFSTLGKEIPVQINGVSLHEAPHHQPQKYKLLHICNFNFADKDTNKQVNNQILFEFFRALLMQVRVKLFQ